MINQVLPRSCRGVRRGERLTNCAGPRRDEPRYNAFTLIELILVVGIIIVLAGLVLSTVGYARKKGARARAETEIAAISAAIENYKADNGVYPSNTRHKWSRCQRREPRHDRSNAISGSQRVPLRRSYLATIAWQPQSRHRARSYMSFKPNMLFPADRHAKLCSAIQIHSATATAIRPSTITVANPSIRRWATIPHSISGAPALTEQPAERGRPKSVDQKLVARDRAHGV